MAGSPYELHRARFAADPGDRAAFEFLEEHLFMRAEWAGLADLYRQRRAAPALADRPRLRAELSLRLGQLCEERLSDDDAAIAAYTEAVHLDPASRRALRLLRGVYARRRQFEVVLQIGEREAALAPPGEERERILAEMAEIWRREVGGEEEAPLPAAADEPRAPEISAELVAVESAAERAVAEPVAERAVEPSAEPAAERTDGPEALARLRRCLELESDRADLLERALDACAARGPLSQLDLIEHAIACADADAARAALLARRGALLADALQWDEEAAESWRAALALDPHQPLARARLGRARSASRAD